jgi:DNA mismatch endonuclease (patch repair protein)
VTDKLTKARRSRNMAAISSKDMKPERAVRSLVHKLGYRFRLHRKDLPGKPDLVFPAKRKVIFVHGCFWHQHPKRSCSDARLPKSNLTYWGPKLASNVRRDRHAQMLLRRAGWAALTLWECETRELIKLEKRVREFLS